jgi:hypothetical protein
MKAANPKLVAPFWEEFGSSKTNTSSGEIQTVLNIIKNKPEKTTSQTVLRVRLTELLVDCAVASTMVLVEYCYN